MRSIKQKLVCAVLAGGLGASLAAPALAAGDNKVARRPVGQQAYKNRPEYKLIYNRSLALGYSFTGREVSALEEVPGGFRVRYAYCDIYYSPAYGHTREIHGDIRARYDFIGGPWSGLGIPVTDELPLEGGDGRGRFSVLANGASIVWHPNTGPMVIKGAIRDEWIRQGAHLSFLGYPTSSEIDLGSGQAFSDFQNGVLVWRNGQVVGPSRVGLNPEQLKILVRRLIEAELRTYQIQALGITLFEVGTNIRWISVHHVSDTRWDFHRSGNRVVTIAINGYIDHPGRNTNFTLYLPMLLDVQRAVGDVYRVSLVLQPGWSVETNGYPILAPELKNALAAGLRLATGRPLPLLSGIPASAVLSVKIMPDGGLTVFGRPEAAIVQGQIQAALDEMVGG